MTSNDAMIVNAAGIFPNGQVGSRILTNSGTIANTLGGTILNVNGAIFYNNGIITNDNSSRITSYGTFTNDTSGILTNKGTFNQWGTFSNLGTLTGTGTLVGNMTNDGTIAPGNSIGTMTINGNYTHHAGAVYEVEVNSAGQSDRLVVSGTTTLNEGLGVAPFGFQGCRGVGGKESFL